MFIAALFTITRAWKQPWCPSTDEWIKKLWYIYTMEYYSAVKATHLSQVQWGRWTQSLLYSEGSQKEKNKYFILTFPFSKLFIFHFMNSLKPGDSSVIIDCNNLLITEDWLWCVPDVVFLVRFAGMSLSTNPHRKALGIVLLATGTQLFLSSRHSKRLIESLVSLFICP